MKYLILSLSTGGGHNSAAQAVADALKTRKQEAEVYDCFGIISPFQSKLVCGAYLWLVKHVPRFFGVLYNSAYRLTKPNRESVVYTINAYNTGRLAKFIHECKPDAIVTTHIFAAQQLTYLKKNGKIDLPLAGVVTDYDVQPLWDETDMDVIFTPHESLSEGYRARGVNNARLVATGIPVAPDVCPAENRREAKIAFGLDPERRHVLVAGGSMGAGKLPDTIDMLLKTLDENVQVIVVCGNNKKLMRRFERMHIDESRLKVEGYVRPLHKLIAACDLFISKPGGLSSTEAFVARCPLIAAHPIQGVESHNADFMKKHGIAVCPDDDEGIVQEACRLLSDEAAREQMLAAIDRHIPQNASDMIAQEMLLLTHKCRTPEEN